MAKAIPPYTSFIRERGGGGGNPPHYWTLRGGGNLPPPGDIPTPKKEIYEKDVNFLCVCQGCFQSLLIIYTVIYYENRMISNRNNRCLDV